MSLDEVKKRFVEEVKLRAFDDKYIDKNEEREILQIALQQGVGVDSARAALAQVCEANEYVLESKVMSELKDLLDTLAGNDGKVDEKEFNDAVSMCKKRRRGRKNRCRFCTKEGCPRPVFVDYKDVQGLKKLCTSQGKLFSRKRSGNCAAYQRAVKDAVKRARFMALLPYVGE